MPIDLTGLSSEAELSEAIVRHASRALRRPPDEELLEQALQLLPRFRAEAATLLEENDRLRAELAEARRRIAVAPGGEALEPDI